MSTTDSTSPELDELHAPAVPEAPPAGEDIHLPPGSILPLVTAFGITLAIVGLTIGRIELGLGIIIFLVATGMWIRDTVRDIDHLPEDHDHGH